jgi:hypothetical protein
MTAREAHARPTRGGTAQRRFGDRYVIAADRIFDGTRVLEHHAVAVWGDRIAAVATADHLSGQGQLIRFAATLLPGFIDLHAHLLLGQVPPETILRHGITTIRDTGGPLVAPSGGDGRLRVLGAGPILTAPGGYPLPVFGPGTARVSPTTPASSSRQGSGCCTGPILPTPTSPGGSTPRSCSSCSTPRMGHSCRWRCCRPRRRERGSGWGWRVSLPSTPWRDAKRRRVALV